MCIMSKLTIVAMLVVLCSCGGSAFTAGEVGDGGERADVRSGSDGGSDTGSVEVDSSSVVVDSSSIEVSTVDSGPIDSGSISTDVVTLDASACTPITPFTVDMGSICGNAVTQMSFQVPAQIVESVEQGCLVPFATPTACQCAETYNCACINFNPGCALPGCTIKNGVIVVYCG